MNMNCTRWRISWWKEGNTNLPLPDLNIKQFCNNCKYKASKLFLTDTHGSLAYTDITKLVEVCTGVAQTGYTLTKVNVWISVRWIAESFISRGYKEAPCSAIMSNPSKQVLRLSSTVKDGKWANESQPSHVAPCRLWRENVRSRAGTIKRPLQASWRAAILSISPIQCCQRVKWSSLYSV